MSTPDDETPGIMQDVHGQFYDLMHIFELNGLPSEENPYLFNGALLSLPSPPSRSCSSVSKHSWQAHYYPLDVTETIFLTINRSQTRLSITGVSQPLMRSWRRLQVISLTAALSQWRSF